MKTTIISLLLFLFFIQSFGQARKVIAYPMAEYNKTIYDRTIGNNPWGVGLGLQAFLNNKTKFQPTIELSSVVYLMDDKVLRSDEDSSISAKYNDVRAMVNFLVGCSFYPGQNVYVSLVAGPSFINGQTLLALKPSVGLYLTKSRKWTGKVSYLNVFNRGKRTKGDFGSITLAFGVRLFK